MKILFVGIFFIVFILNGFSQTNERDLFFCKDLFVIAKQQDNNLQAYSNDEVRATIAKFNAKKKAHIIASNKRDTALTVSFWFRPKNLDVHSGTIIGEDSVFYFRYLSNRKIQFNHYCKKDINTAGVLTSNEWQHLGFTLNKKGKLAIYFNGDCVLKDSISANWWSRKRNIILGKDPYGVDAEGSIDELRMWSRALSSSEMQLEFKHTLLFPGLSYQLATYLPLKGDFSDFSDEPKTLEEAIGVQFVTDSLKGIVANFQDDNSHITTSGFSFDNQMTISTWAKPTNKNWVMALAGNRDFSMRYIVKSGRLWFNVPMVYSCQSANWETKFGEWMHLALSVNYNHKVCFYVNGKLLDSKKIQGKTGKEEAIKIGQSMWGNTFNGKMANFAIWNRALSEDEIMDVYNGKLDVLLQNNKKTPVYIYLCLLLFVLLIAMFLMWFIANKKLKKNKVEQSKLAVDSEKPKKNALYFFETFRAFNNEGIDISNDFTPILIRLFSLILLFPRIYNRYISSQEMSDILWESDSLAQQKNNRGTNIHRLRSLLNQFDNLSLVYRNKVWVIENTEKLFVDLFDFELRLSKGQFNLPFKKIQLCKPIKKENLDGLVRLLNDRYIDALRTYCILSLSKKDWISLNNLAALWLTIDPLSENALCYTVKALVNSKQKQKALNTYIRFKANYKLMLNEELHLSFTDCLSTKGKNN